jgi:hypothetical protein
MSPLAFASRTTICNQRSEGRGLSGLPNARQGDRGVQLPKTFIQTFGRLNCRAASFTSAGHRVDPSTRQNSDVAEATYSVWARKSLKARARESLRWGRPGERLLRNR